MELLAVGGDLRYAYMIRMAREQGMDASALGPEHVDALAPVTGLDELRHAECVVMPNPFGAQPPKLPLSARALFEHLPSGAALMLFGTGPIPEEIETRYRVHRLTEYEPLTQVLARQTAEGAIHAVCERAPFELYGCHTLLVGYGRIARALHRMLKGYEARITVAARHEGARAEAEEAGARAVDMEDMERLLPAQQAVFSTPPERVLDARRIALLDRRALLVDLSSPPYGVDLAAAHARWLSAWREPGLPGRYCPESAGAAMLKAVQDLLRKEGV